jgi:hypothetical protein
MCITIVIHNFKSLESIAYFERDEKIPDLKGIFIK